MDVAIRDAMVPGAAAPEFFDHVRELGVTKVEVELAPDLSTPRLVDSDGTPYRLADAAGRQAFADRLGKARLTVSAWLLATDFCGADAERHVAWAGAAAELAASLGHGRVIRIDPLALDKQLPREIVLERFVSRARELLAETADERVQFAVENHGPFANDPAFLDALFDGVGNDPRLTLTLDTGNFYWFGFPREAVYGLIEKYAPRTAHTHLKNINYPPGLADVRREVGAGYKEYCCALDEGNLDLGRIAGILRGGGYVGDLCIENESLFKHPPEARLGVLKRDVAAARMAMRE